MPPKKVVIIGAGASGVFTAYLLEKQAPGQFDITILEKNDRVGGHARRVVETSWTGDSVSIDKEIGVKLEVTPDVLPNDMLKLRVFAERTFLTQPSRSVEFQYRLDTTKTSVNATVAMKYLNPQTRTAARGLGFGGMASYAVLRGPAAALRTKTSTPSFLVAAPNQAQPESYFMLASFAVRRNNSREVLIGGGYMSYSSGVHPDRIVALERQERPWKTS